MAKHIAIARPERLVEKERELREAAHAERFDCAILRKPQRRIEDDGSHLEYAQGQRDDRRVALDHPLARMQANSSRPVERELDALDPAVETDFDLLGQLLGKRLETPEDDAVSVSVDLVAVVPIVGREDLGSRCPIVPREQVDMPANEGLVFWAQCASGAVFVDQGSQRAIDRGALGLVPAP